MFTSCRSLLHALTKVNNGLGDCQRQWAQPGAIATYEDECLGLAAGTVSIRIGLSHCYAIRGNELYVFNGPFKKTVNQVSKTKGINTQNSCLSKDSI